MPEMTPAAARTDFRSEIKTALNRASAENGSDTPDHVLADYLMACLDAFDASEAAVVEGGRASDHSPSRRVPLTQPDADKSRPDRVTSFNDATLRQLLAEGTAGPWFAWVAFNALPGLLDRTVRVEALHRPDGGIDGPGAICVECTHQFGTRWEEPVSYPCPTVLALDGPTERDDL